MLYIFDWDGTISDSAPKIIACMQKAAEDAGLDVLDDHTIKNIIGLGLPEAIHALYPEITPNKAEALRLNYVDHFVNDDVNPSPFFPGVMETLHQLLDQGHMLTVATGKSRKGLNRVWQNLSMESFFHGSRCADETASKPNPLMLEELLLEFDVSVEEAVMIGDTEYDMAMAHSLGMKKIAVSYGAHHIDRLKNYEPVLCVDEFDKILSW
ncbi:MAG: HAD-IA family hydrolase [Agarilytica sp.]